ncbi:MAG: bifunctional (p)ppGpp synthetase/guanosine-3',5'-bis(diphosphate) 3'-pyrophosphohydrolase [Candidatus Delongbacteria bacterium]|nr:bifunctional (p)ppGpp synthetase/guanosine-3',5'-bis(diphosphate) 3'-pyrophosphohydrolase [Candidatus Delongbacteria bacterium]MBN2836498.1 bifunctional (p)ppGpp synthetase/guanosine-3',5'-bis(diphosphate) 3'-pyrophosphohydrolase [Candidatus Delongbacteria bacterium]
MIEDTGKYYTDLRLKYQQRVNDIIIKLKKINRNVDEKLINESYIIAFNAHKGVMRDDKVTPYIEHPVEVAEILSDLEVDDVTISAALLHDVVEDSVITGNDIKRKYGETISNIVDGLTKEKSKEKSKIENQTHNYKKLVSGMISELRIIIIKMADRLHNMKTLGHLSVDRKERIANETRNFFIPLANKLGMHKFKLELDDLVFKILDSRKYNEMIKSLDHYNNYNNTKVSEAVESIKSKLKNMNIDSEVSINRRSIYSIASKINFKNFEESKKYFSLKVVVGNKSNCYNVLQYIHEIFVPLNLISDYISGVKKNGYQSLHTKVMDKNGLVYEIIIRNVDMDVMADLGIIHLLYNINRDTENSEYELNKYKDTLSSLYNDSFSSMEDHYEVIDIFHKNLVTGEIIISTPKDETYTLPAGSSVLDFAYKIHTDIGNQCVAAKVNGQSKPVTYKLQNNDVVQIITSRTTRPKEEWLDFVVTARAIKSIKHSLKKSSALQNSEKKSILERFSIRKKVKEESPSKTVRSLEIITKFYDGFISRIEKEIKYIDRLLNMEIKIENETAFVIVKGEFINDDQFRKFLKRVNSMKDIINVYEL